MIPLNVIIAEVNRGSLASRIEKLTKYVRLEKPHSMRRAELEALLKGCMTKQLKLETRK